MVLFQLFFEALEQGEGISGASGKSGKDLIFIEPAYLAGIALEHRVALRDLAVATNHDLAASADRENGCAVQLFQSSAPQLVTDNVLSACKPSCVGLRPVTA